MRKSKKIDHTFGGKVRPYRCHLGCPACKEHEGFSYLYPNYKCQKCKAEMHIFDMLRQALKSDSELWHPAFHALSLYNLAPIHEAIVHSDTVVCTVHQQLELDLNARGLPKEARILYMNLTPGKLGEYEGSVIPTLSFLQNRRSIDDLPHRFFLYGQPLGFKNPPKGDEFSNITIFLRWCSNNVSIIQEHLIHAAENYWKDDIERMVYNCFSAVDLASSDLIESYWTKAKKINKQDHENLFGRENAEKILKSHLPMICQEFNIDLAAEKDKLRLIKEDLRLQRNNVVHSGKLRTDMEGDKKALFAITCWFLVLVDFLNQKIQQKKP